MRIIKITGLSLFLIGFVLFNISLFLSKYSLTEDLIRRKITDPVKAKLFLTHANSLLAKSHLTQFAFVAGIRDVFRKVNEQQKTRYSITGEEVNALLSLHGGKFSIAAADSLFSGTGEISVFKREAFREYGGWLDGQTFDSKDVLRSKLREVQDKIEAYGIVNRVGFDRYQVKDLTYSITKSAGQGVVERHPGLFLFLTFGLCVIGSLLFFIPKLQALPGIKNNGIYANAMKNGGGLGISLGLWLILFYVLLYFYPEYMTSWISMVDPISNLINGGEASRFFLYGFIYTLCILVMGLRLMIHYRHSKYQILRTCSVMFFQTAVAFLIPEFLIRLNKPYFDFKNIWPLDYGFFFDSHLDELVKSGTLGIFMIGWGIALIVLAVPILVYFFGKRWYCSWVCGCGGLAETLGDPYRQLSNKSLKAWKVERWTIHGVLVFAVVMTAGVLYTYFTKASWLLFFDTYTLREIYGSFIGAGFAGVVGTGFYPVMGNRVWCRFGCPLAAYLGLVQRFKSRFRITTNGGQCISCGNCSTYCEMGIDVRWYAQRGQNIVRSSCVGCGICSAVCPRGVLNLETKEEKGRFGKPILLGNNNVKLVQ